MSRPVGIRDKPDLYPRILDTLRKPDVPPAGLAAATIAKRIQENHCTVKTYLLDMVEDGRVTGVKVLGGKRTHYVVGKTGAKSGASDHQES